MFSSVISKSCVPENTDEEVFLFLPVGLFRDTDLFPPTAFLFALTVPEGLEVVELDDGPDPLASMIYKKIMENR